MAYNYGYMYSTQSLCLIDSSLSLRAYNLSGNPIKRSECELYDNIKNLQGRDSAVHCPTINYYIKGLIDMARVLGKVHVDRDTVLFIPKSHRLDYDLLFLGKERGIVCYRQDKSHYLLGYYGIDYTWDDRCVTYNEDSAIFNGIQNLWCKFPNDILLGRVSNVGFVPKLFNEAEKLIGASKSFYSGADMYMFEVCQDAVLGNRVGDGLVTLVFGNQNLFRDISKVINLGIA